MDRNQITDSPYNRHYEVTESFNLSPVLIVNDCTLREGEQTAAANFTLEEKLEIAALLEEAGIHQLQGGYPGRSPIDFKFVQQFKKQRQDIKIEAIAQVFQKDWKDQISRSLDCEPDVLDLIYPSSDLRLKYVQKISRDQMLERSIEAVEFARDQGAVVRFAPVDTTRTDFEFLMKLFDSVIAAGSERITIADTAGAITPTAMGFLVRESVRRFSVPVQVHCHNDFGLALANALAAVEAGASIIDVTVNGIGERAGNVSLDELAIALTVFYDMDSGIDTTKLNGLARHVEKLTKVPIHEYKPLIGRAAFTHKLDAHVKGVLAHPPLYEVIPPESVGNRRIIPIGKYTGPVVIRAKLDELDLSVSDEEVRAIMQEVERRAADRHASLSEDEFRAIVRETTSKQL
jgi:isopropylmalate/homocitrate/citramalate synthase